MMGWMRRLLYRPPDAEQALDAWRRERAELVDAFLEAARATGLPRELTWESVEANGEPLMVRSRAGGLIALVPVMVQFEPVPGSEMEEIPQAREPRPVTALFVFEDRGWRTVGKAVFNLSPTQVVERSAGAFEVVSPRPTSR